MSKKLLTLAMALLMVIGVFAGCAKTPAAEPAAEPDAEPAAEPVAEPAAESAAEPVAEPVEEPAAVLDMSQKQTLELSLWDIDLAWGADIPVDKLGQYILDKFNIEITTRNVGWGDAGEKYNLWAAANDLPATVSKDYVGGTTYYQWINEGVVRALPDLSMFPTLLKNNKLSEVTAYDVEGKQYFLPRMSYADPTWWCMDRGVYYRKDWAANLGMAEPTTEQEFIDLVVAYAKNDPDGNGNNDTVGLTGVGVGSGWIFWSQGFANYGKTQGDLVLNEDGTVSNSGASEQAYKIACMLRELNQKGGLDPDYMTMASDDDAINKFCAGTSGILMKQISATHANSVRNKWAELQPDKDFYACVDFMKMNWDTGAKPVCFGEKAYWSETYFGNKVTDEEMPRYLALYDWMASDEGIVFLGFGFEGEDYTVDADGIYTSLLPMKDNGTRQGLGEKYPNQIFCYLSVWNSDINQYRNPAIDEELRKMTAAERDRRLAEWEPANIDWKLQSVMTEEREEATYNLNSDWLRMVLDTSAKTNEEWYTELKAKWDTEGYQASMDSIAAAYAEMIK